MDQHSKKVVRKRSVHDLVAKTQERLAGAEHAEKARKRLLEGVKPGEPVSMAQIMDLHHETARRIDEAYADDIDQSVPFRLIDPDPAVAQGAPDAPYAAGVQQTTSIGPSVVSDMPTHLEIEDEDGKKRIVRLDQTEAYRAWVQRVFRAEYERQGSSLADLTPFRIKTAWRITRQLVRILGLGRDDEPLSAALSPREDNEDPWMVPEPASLPATGRGTWPEVLRVIREAEALPESLQPCLRRLVDPADPEKGSEWVPMAGFAVMPPPVTRKWLENGRISADYDPHNDVALNLFSTAVKLIADRLKVPNRKSEKVIPANSGHIYVHDPLEDFRKGLLGLTDPVLIRLSWPSRTELVVWESMMVEAALEYLVEGSVGDCKRRLKEEYGLNNDEIAGLIRQANALALEQTSADKEEVRALMLLRLENFLQRARNSLDMRSEMYALKQMSIIQGLADGGGDNPMQDFLDSVRMVASERSRSLSPAPSRFVENTALPSGSQMEDR